jgi:short-subunit dehydrogenase
MSRFQFTDSVALVTGASRGIGPHIARALIAEGSRVAVMARHRADLEEVARALRDAGGDVLALPGDVTASADRCDAVRAVQARWGTLDILVNNAGGDLQREFHLLDENEITSVIDLNLTSAVLLTRAVLPGMLERSRGHVVNVSSMAGRTGFPFTEAYGAAKDGLVAFTRVLRGDYARSGVSASSLILGPIRGTGVGERTAKEVEGVSEPPAAFSATASQVGAACVRAVAKDRAELVVMPGPGRSLRALMDRFPGLGPAANRAAGVEETMRRVADYRQRQAVLTTGG